MTSPGVSRRFSTAEGQGWATIAAAGRNVTITGIAPSTELQQMAVELATSVSGCQRGHRSKRSFADRLSLCLVGARRPGGS